MPSSEVAVPTQTVDLTGYWVLSKVDNLDVFLRNLGFPWVARRAALRFGSTAVDVIAQTGSSVTCTTLNPKGSWQRIYDTERTVEQLDALGVTTKTSSWWEGNVFRSRLEGNPLGICDSWRYLRGSVMIVKTTVKRPQGLEASCFWFYERMEALEAHLGGGSKSHLLRAIAKDQHRIRTATRKDTAHLQKVLTADVDRWSSPADEFIHIAAGSSSSPSPITAAGAGGNVSPRGGRRVGSSVARLRANASPASTPHALSHSPSSQSLTAVSPSSGSDVMKRRFSGGGGGGGAEEAPQNNNNNRPLTPASAAGGNGNGNGVTSNPSTASLSTTAADGGGAAGAAAAAAASIALPPLSHPPPQAPTSTSSAAGAAAPPRVWSSDSASAAVSAASASVSRRAVHYRSPSSDSLASNTLSQATPLSLSPSQAARRPPTGPEALLVLKLHEYLDSRGISAVVPVATPNDTNEPQLLEMSPEQAEDTAARLRELETELLLHRQGSARGFVCCGIVLTREADSLPEHLRVWEMTLA